MSKWNVVRRCYNCGVILQSEDEQKDGYIEEKHLDSAPSTILFCEHCWKQQRYNIAPREPSIDPDFLKMLADAKASDALIVYVVNLFSFESAFSSRVCQAISGLKMLVLANKRDLLPKKLDEDDLREYVAHRFRVAKLNVRADQVILTSLTTSSDVSRISARIQQMRRGHDVYVIGGMQTGKTLFISAFLKGYSNVSDRYIKTANYPDTKLQVMQIPLDKSSMIYDTPGIPFDNAVNALVDLSTGRVEPSGPVSPRPVALSLGESLFIGGLARIDMLGGEKTSFRCFFARDVSLKKVAKNVDPIFVYSIEKNAVAPTSKLVRSLQDFDAFDMEVEETGERDIGIEGLGWLSFTANRQKIRLYVPKGVSIYTSRAKIKQS
ncbi:MAG: hypothetical protein Q4F15_01920 [Bacillota bacterium]|nr:hypothetical protein [Bacillota bacterium]